MTNHEKIAFKVKLKNFGLRVLTQRISTAQSAMNRAQEAANSEEKSSSGDKYETGRAMGHLEKEMYGRQVAEYAKEIKALQSVAADFVCDQGVPGAFIRAAGVAFFVCAGLGKQDVDGSTVVFVSPGAPLAGALKGKKPGDIISFNGTQMGIQEVY